MARVTAGPKSNVIKQTAFRLWVAMRPKGAGGAPRTEEPVLWYASLLFVGARSTLEELRTGRRPRQGDSSRLGSIVASELRLSREHRIILGKALAKPPSEAAWGVVWAVMGFDTPSERAIRGYLRRRRAYVAGMVAIWQGKPDVDRTDRFSEAALELLSRGASLALDQVIADARALEELERSRRKRLR